MVRRNPLHVCAQLTSDIHLNTSISLSTANYKYLTVERVIRITK